MMTSGEAFPGLARIGQIAVPVTDLDRAAAFYDRLMARMPDHELSMAFLRDSEGNLLGLMSEVQIVSDFTTVE